MFGRTSALGLWLHRLPLDLMAGGTGELATAPSLEGFGSFLLHDLSLALEGFGTFLLQDLSLGSSIPWVAPRPHGGRH